MLEGEVMSWSGGDEVAERMWNLVKDIIPKDRTKKVAEGIINILADQDWDTGYREPSELFEAAGYSNDPTEEVEKEVRLYFADGTSDKIYIIKIVQIEEDKECEIYLYEVRVEYGRRTGPYKKETKLHTDSWNEALEEFYSLSRSKKKKGYHED